MSFRPHRSAKLPIRRKGPGCIAYRLGSVTTKNARATYGHASRLLGTARLDMSTRRHGGHDVVIYHTPKPNG